MIPVRQAFRRIVKLGALLLVLAVTPLFCVLAALGWVAPAMKLWFRLLAAALWIRVSVRGAAPSRGCLVVANHVGYLDPLVVASRLPSRFLAKSEISRWPVIGRLSRFGRVLFVERDRPRSVATVIEAIAQRLAAGDRIVLFPEAGVSSDGRALGEFRPMIFEASIASGRPVVPVAVRYVEPDDPEVWAWYDNSGMGSHAWERLLPAPGIRAELRIGEALTPVEGEGRKELAARARTAVTALLSP